MRREVVASLEGARVVVTDNSCELGEYNFSLNCWKTVQKESWPLSREQASRWLQGWNRLDAFKARMLLLSDQNLHNTRMDLN